MVKKFGKAYFKASIWLVFYLLMQSITTAGVFLYKIYHDIDYANACALAIEPYVDENYAVRNRQEMMKKCMEFFQEITTPILFISGIIIIIMTILYIIKKHPREFQRESAENIWKYTSIGISANFLLTLILNLLPPEMLGNHQEATSYILNHPFLWVLLSTGVISPVVEEMIFRFGVQKNFLPISTGFAILFQAFLFGMLHGNLIQGSYAFLLGTVMGMIVWKTGKVYNSMAFHCGVNISSVVIARFFGESVFWLGMMAVESILIYCLVKRRGIRRIKRESLFTGSLGAVCDNQKTPERIH